MQAPIDPSLRISAVRLAVSDLARSIGFYARVLGLALISRDGQSATLGAGEERPALALSAEDLHARAPDEPPQEIEPKTVIGHVHLKVGDVSRARSFSHDVLGFSEQATLPSAAFLAADGYHHHIGLNPWQSLGANAPPPTAPGLRLVEFTLGDPDSLAQLERGIAQAPGGPFEIRRERER